MKLTGAVITKNEEANIFRCIKSLEFCDEIIVIDDHSIDKTVEIAERLGAKVYKRRLNGDFAAQRNYAISKAKNDWVLFVDADEVISKNLKTELLDIDNKLLNYVGYFIKRRDIFMGKKLKYGESGNIKLLRLGNKFAGIWKRKVHEYWDINGEIGQLQGKLIHFPHRTLREFIEHISKYSMIHSKENEKEGKEQNIYKIIFYPLGKFFYNYFYKIAIFDGLRGFIVSIFMSFHSFISWSSLWLSKRKKN